MWLALACWWGDMSIRLPRPRLTPGVKRVLGLMAPGIVGAGVVQINLVIDVILASTLPEGSISFLYYADRVNQLPLGVVGVAVGIALLPLLTRQLAEGDGAGAADSQNRAIEIALLLTVPPAAALLVIPGPIVSVLFERGAFSEAASVATSRALAAFAAGLPAYVLIKALTPGFFARQDTATPVKIAIIAVVANVVLAIALMQVLAHVGIALATACSAWLNAGMLAATLKARGHLVLDERLRRRVPLMVLTAGLMAIGLWAGAAILEPALAGGVGQRIAALAGLVLGGLLLFAGLAHVTGAADFGELRRLLRRDDAAGQRTAEDQ